MVTELNFGHYGMGFIAPYETPLQKFLYKIMMFGIIVNTVTRY